MLNSTTLTAAGCLPYWSQLPSIDMLGLNDYYIPRHKPNDIGNGLLGHELGDGNYVISLLPDIIVFNVGSMPAFRAGLELSKNKRFHEQYSKIKIRTSYQPYYEALVWFSKYSKSIGVIENEGCLVIPAYYFNTFKHTIAAVYKGTLVIYISKDYPAGMVLENVLKDCTISLISENREQINCDYKHIDNRIEIILTTQSETPVPVEAIRIDGILAR